ncbi:hypothetical protein [Tengunoibacter tsumagoiensis]|uniref:DUF4386 domain-containing protein n=1 Tax=Tengunoibacter tsumagoiensis TaxID=2014871 RepID=A0A402A8A4_9CHLR|nr:hypothetical protein [Tengunoibacter tsumagoiensis]GCE15382.1 hypothetical protein KTT_52410 [Tengunoibacter tsumagoiensis]
MKYTMSSTTLYRLSGISVLIGGLFAALAAVPVFFTGEDPASSLAATAALLRIIGDMLIVVGLPGVYSRQAQQAGLFGLIGFLFTFVYILIQGVVGDTVEAFILPFLASAAPSLVKGSPPQGLVIFFLVGGLLGVVGSVLLGVMTLRAKTVARWAGLPLIVGVVLSLTAPFLPPVVGTTGMVLFLIGLAWLGFGVWLPRQPTSQLELPLMPLGPEI